MKKILAFTLFLVMLTAVTGMVSTASAQVGNPDLDRIRAAFGNTSSSSNQVTYGNGVYTNLCGSGTDANAHTCNNGCNPSTGSCSSSGNTVVKFTCEGRQTECRSNESSFRSSQSLAGTACGKTVQIDVFSKNCRSGSNWTCGDEDLLDYMVWYSGDCSQDNSCSQYEPINTQFRRSGTSTWISGNEVVNLQPGNRVDVNCFAENGGSLLPGGVIYATTPSGNRSLISTTAEARNYTLESNGTYSFECVSETIAQCTDTDSLTVQETDQTPTPSPGVTPTPTPVPTPDPHDSSCDDLDVVGGNNALVPAKVTLRARGSDSDGNIQKYKFYFGDGEQVETTELEVQHTYEVSGSFIARVDVKDTQGNWKTSDSCEATVTVKPSSIESHKSACSDVFISANNGATAPSTVTFDINGYDNKGNIQEYRINTDDNRVIEDGDDKIEHVYDTPGMYTIRAYIKDSQGNWVGGDNGCKRTLYINTQPLKSQPDTGTPTWFTISGLLTGGAGVSLQIARKKMLNLV